MRRSDGLRFLTQCADLDGRHWSGGYEYAEAECPTCNGTNCAGHLACFSEYGSTSADCAPVAWRVAYIFARESGEPITRESLDYAMSLVVNEHDVVRHLIANYGWRHYR